MPLRCLCGNPRRHSPGVRVRCPSEKGVEVRNFSYARASTSQDALGLITKLPNAKFLGGGTNLIDLMRENIEQPDALIDVTRLASGGITESETGGISIPAGVKNTAVANHPLIRQR